MTELSAHGHSPVWVANGAEALELATENRFDAITLDRMLPGLDGLTLISILRQRRVSVPVLMISALSDVDERIAGLRAGGDDYLIKPFVPGEMATRVDVLLRRTSERAEGSTLRVGTITLDLIRRAACVGDRSIKLLPVEFRLLEFLVRNAGQPISRRIIFEQVWGYHFDPGANLINVHIARLRKKLDAPDRPSLITTIKGEGYRLDAD